jgi:hypothetical protein
MESAPNAGLDSRERALLDDLDPLNQMLAVLEKTARLDGLVVQRRLQAAVSDGMTEYAAP